MTRKEIPLLHSLHPLHERYIRLTEELPVIEALQKHSDLFTAEDKRILEQLGDRTYAPGKWNVRDILQHLVDTERILSYRAVCIARNDQSAFPGFDENSYSKYTEVQRRSVAEMLEEFDLVRRSTIRLFQSFTNEMLQRTGTCSDIPVSVLALGFLLSGHPVHHVRFLKDHYFQLVSSSLPTIVINKPGYLPFFESLNRAWIEKDFSLEPDDLYVLQNAQKAILDKGGVILYAENGGKVIGTVALQRVNGSEWEMIKMAVDEGSRGRGIGSLLIRSAINKAREMGIPRLVLHSNTGANAQAVSLYRRFGFAEIPITDSRYKRANIKMELNIFI